MGTTLNNSDTSNATQNSLVMRCTKKIFTRKGMAILCVIMALAFCLYDFVILPQFDSWGTTREEAIMTLPGDVLAPSKPMWRMTVATTIDAPPEKVFPYFVQMGQDKAGFYSADWLERAFGFGIHNTYTVVPEWQDTKAGDFCTFHKAGMGMRIYSVTPNRNLIMVTNGLEPNHPLPPGKWEMLLTPLFPRERGDYVAWDWDFNLFPLPGGKTRVVVRAFASTRGNPLSKFIFKHAFALPSDIMDIEMLKRVKMLAEGTYPVH